MCNVCGYSLFRPYCSAMGHVYGRDGATIQWTSERFGRCTVRGDGLLTLGSQQRRCAVRCMMGQASLHPILLVCETMQAECTRWRTCLCMRFLLRIEESHNRAGIFLTTVSKNRKSHCALRERLEDTSRRAGTLRGPRHALV